MNDFKIKDFVNGIVKVTGFVCVTWAAIAFNNYHLLWWYIAAIIVEV